MKSIDLTEDTVEADGPPKKKLKQATLQFQVRSPVTKKRKLSDAHDDSKTLKQVKTDCKENLPRKPNDQQSVQSENDVLVTNLENDTSQEKRPKGNISDERTLNREIKDRESDSDVKILAEVCNNTVKLEESAKEAEKSNEQTATGSESSAEEKTSCLKDNFEATRELAVLLTRENLEQSTVKTNESVGETEISTILSDSEDEKTSNCDPVTSDSDSEDDKSIDEHADSNKNDSTPLSTPLKDVSRKLTPKQIQRKLESEKKREHRERARQEREKKRQEEKEEKLKQKQEKEEQKRKEREEKEEQKRKEREEKEEQKRKEKEEKEEAKRREREEKEQKRKDREEKEKKRQAEIEIRNEEKRKKEEQKEKAAAAFERFFVPKKVDGKQEGAKAAQDAVSKFEPFQPKSDMRMAPTLRRTLENDAKDALERALSEQNVDEESLYLSEVKTGKPTGSSSRTWPVEESKDDAGDVICIDDEAVEVLCGNLVETAAPVERRRAKLLQFSENRRPPYWGTWRKRSKNIKSRRPFGTDQIFNYEVDSDDEWEEEEPGESLRGSDDDESGSDNEYDIDNDFMVPHGYLSDEEALVEEDDALTPETHKAKLELLEKEFQAEMKSKTERLKPRLIGCLWANENNDRPASGSEVIWKFLSARRMMTGGAVVFPERDANPNADDPTSPLNPDQSAGKKKRGIPEQFVPDLIELVHGNTNGKTFLFREFKAHLNSVNPELEISRRSFEIKMKEIAKWICVESDGPLLNKYCWLVRDEALAAYRRDGTGIVNSWKYVLSPPKTNVYRKSVEDGDNKCKPKEKKKSVPDIKQFTKVLSNEEKQKQFASKKRADTGADGSSERSPFVKKRIQPTTLSSSKTVGEGSSKEIGKRADTSAENSGRNCESSERVPKKRAALTSVPKVETKKSKASTGSVRSNLLTQFIKKVEKKEGIFKETAAGDDGDSPDLIPVENEEKNKINLTEMNVDSAVVLEEEKLVEENPPEIESSENRGSGATDEMPTDCARTGVERTRFEKRDDEKSAGLRSDRNATKSNSKKTGVLSQPPETEKSGDGSVNDETSEEKPPTDKNKTNDVN